MRVHVLRKWTLPVGRSRFACCNITQ